MENKQVKEILRKIPEETRRKLTAKGHIPQEGYILEYLPVPPNCLSVPEASDGFSSMSVVRHLKQNIVSSLLNALHSILVLRIRPESSLKTF